MNKFLFFIVSLFVLIPTFAQETHHMKFMGITMDCDAESFSQKLIDEKGLAKSMFDSKNGVVLFGSFAGYDNCYFVIKGNVNIPVYAVGVIFPPQNTFLSVKSQYNTLKMNLISKYGNPVSCEEVFRNGEPLTDNDRLKEIKEGNAIFETIFHVEEGFIKLQMTSSDNDGNSHIIYIDNENAKLQSQKTLDDL